MYVMDFTNLTNVVVDVDTYKHTGTENGSSPLTLRDLITTLQQSMATISLKGTLFVENQLLLGLQF